MLKANPKTSWNSNECLPSVAATAYVDESAMVIGDVRIGEEVYVAPLRIPAGGRGQSHHHR